MKKLLSLFICAIGISACSRIDIAVTWADTYISSKVDDYFDITSHQKKILKESIRDDLRRLRQEQFKLWAAELNQLHHELTTNTLDENKLREYFQRSLQNSKKIQPYFSQTASQFISSTTPEQLNYFERAFQKKAREDHKKVQTTERMLKENQKTYRRWIDMWLGSLSKDQERLLNQHLQESPFPLDLQIKNREQVVVRIQELRHSPDELKNFIRDYYKDRYQYTPPEYQRALANYQAGLEKFLIELLKSLNEKQKQTLSENLLEKAAILDRLSVAKN